MSASEKGKKRYCLDETLDRIGDVISKIRDTDQHSLNLVSFTFRPAGLARTEWQQSKRKLRKELMKALSIQTIPSESNPETFVEYNVEVEKMLSKLPSTLSGESNLYTQLVKAYDDAHELIVQEKKAYDIFKSNEELVKAAVEGMIEYHKSRDFKPHLSPTADRILSTKDIYFRPKWWVLKGKSTEMNGEDKPKLLYEFSTLYNRRVWPGENQVEM